METYDFFFEFGIGSGRFHTDLFFQRGDLVFQLFDVFFPFKFTFLDSFNGSFLRLGFVGLKMNKAKSLVNKHDSFLRTLPYYRF
jgi:hypothetical protein